MGQIRLAHAAACHSFPLGRCQHILVKALTSPVALTFYFTLFPNLFDQMFELELGSAASEIVNCSPSLRRQCRTGLVAPGDFRDPGLFHPSSLAHGPLGPMWQPELQLPHLHSRHQVKGWDKGLGVTCWPELCHMLTPCCKRDRMAFRRYQQFSLPPRTCFPHST